MARRCQGAPVPQAIMRMGVRWSLASPLRSRPGAALLDERGGLRAHATLQRWVVQDSPRGDEAFPRRQRPGGLRWRMEETAITLQGPGSSLSRAVAPHGPPMALLRTKQRAKRAATRCLPTARRRPGAPDKLPIAGRAAQQAASERENEAHGPALESRPITSLKHIVAQDPRAGTRVPRPLLGLPSVSAARRPLVGLALLPMRKQKPRVGAEGPDAPRAPEQCYALAAYAPPQTRATDPFIPSDGSSPLL
jgi:transposase-like protein